MYQFYEQNIMRLTENVSNLLTTYYKTIDNMSVG